MTNIEISAIRDHGNPIQAIEIRKNGATPYNKRPGDVADCVLTLKVINCKANDRNDGWISILIGEHVTHHSGAFRTNESYISLPPEARAELVALLTA